MQGMQAMSPHEYPMVRYGRILPHSLQGQKLMLLPLQSVECYTAYASADVIGRRISLMSQTVEVQRFAIDEMIAMECVAPTQFAVYRFEDGEHAQPFVLYRHIPVRFP